MQYETKTYTNYDHWFRVFAARREQGLARHSATEFLDHWFVGRQLKNLDTDQVYTVDKVYCQWQNFEWLVFVLMHKENRSSAIRVVGKRTKGRLYRLEYDHPVHGPSSASFWNDYVILNDDEWTPLCDIPI